MAALTGVTVSAVQCPGCREMVPVECGDVAGMTVDAMIDAAADAARRTCPDHGERILVGVR